MAEKRPPIPKSLQVRVLRRDKWLCRYCGRPVVFGPAMKFLEQLVRESGWSAPLAVFHHNWTRTHAPLLDELGAVVDHEVPHAEGGAGSLDNLVTACNKCNTRKNKEGAASFVKRNPKRRIKGKYGEPVAWDGLSSLFIVLLGRNPSKATRNELGWYKAMTKG